MKRGLIFGIVMMIGCATGVSVRDLVVPARAQNQTGPSYQYSAFYILNSSNEQVQAALDKYAAQGWRLSNSFHSGCCGVQLIFERQVQK
ncbi:DUF4177 domain-containing protein [Pendulispora brunnea]|uniref:DUF4177 domain-containing protein n=1 Tax=Pendulispora brunnea TaxID=2905690 RepID=A0ABZ2K6J1_9BACT